MKDKKNTDNIVDEMINKNSVGKKKLLIIILAVIALFLSAGICIYIFLPNIKLNGMAYLELDLNSVYQEQGVKITLNGKEVNKKVQVKGNVDTSKIGKYEVEYSIKRGPFTTKTTRVVEVVDRVFPVIELVGTKKATVCPNYDYKEEGYKATDNYDGDITDKVIIEQKDNLISYRVKDSSNNEVIESREIIRQDNKKPTLSLVGPNTKYVLVGSNYKDQGFEVEDNCDYGLKEKVVKTGTVDTGRKGTYKVVYSVTDSSGNKAEVTRTVVVYDKATAINGTNKTGTIYLTFDDGPSATITPGVLKILREKGVKATFFVINHSSNLDYLIKQAYDDGHTIGLHSYTHNYKQIYSSGAAYFDDLHKIGQKVKKITGQESKIIRFPGGGSNTVSARYSKGIMTYLSNEVINQGYHYFDWNVGSGDAGEAKNSAKVYKNVVNGLKANRANIVLMHDFENNYKTLNALSDIIDYGLSHGYSFLPIDMTTPLVTHKVNN